jgi:putative transposase
VNNDTTTSIQMPEASTKDVLTEILRDGAQAMLGKAIEAEVADYIAAHAHHRDDDGHRLVVRNGHAPERGVQTGLGAISVKQPRVNDKWIDDDGNRFRFTSSILPPYLRKTKVPGGGVLFLVEIQDERLHE